VSNKYAFIDVAYAAAAKQTGAAPPPGSCTAGLACPGRGFMSGVPARPVPPRNAANRSS
jgi:hypothetical protein